VNARESKREENIFKKLRGGRSKGEERRADGASVDLTVIFNYELGREKNRQPLSKLTTKLLTRKRKIARSKIPGTKDGTPQGDAGLKGKKGVAGNEGKQKKRCLAKSGNFAAPGRKFPPKNR